MEDIGRTTHLKVFDLSAQPIHANDADACAQSKCPGICLKTPQGAVCRCPDRFTLNANGSQCIAIVEFDKPSNCTSGFECLKSKQCVDNKDLCDGFDDCDDGSDESSNENGPCNPKKCDTNLHFICDNRCYQRSLRCSSITYCSDESDQKNCENNVCNKNEFKCVKSGKCISLAWLNDGADDCGMVLLKIKILIRNCIFMIWFFSCRT